MTGYQSKKAAALDEEGMYLVHQTAQPAQEPVAWPCLIDTADFSKGTVTIVMRCTDYTLSTGTHWLSTTPPAAQRTWVGLTDEQIKTIEEMSLTKNMAIAMTMATLKEKNT